MDSMSNADAYHPILDGVFDSTQTPSPHKNTSASNDWQEAVDPYFPQFERVAREGFTKVTGRVMSDPATTVTEGPITEKHYGAHEDNHDLLRTPDGC